MEYSRVKRLVAAVGMLSILGLFCFSVLTSPDSSEGNYFPPDLPDLHAKYRPFTKREDIAVPTSMKLLREVRLPCPPHSVCQYGEITYTGLEDDSVMKISGGNVTQVEKLAMSGSYICVYQDYIYTIATDIKVYNLCGVLVRSWSHTCNSGTLNQLRIVRDNMVVSDGNKVTVYSLLGKHLKDIPFADTSRGNWKSGAACGDNFVCLIDRGSRSVLKIDIDSGEVLWTSKHVTFPQGVVCYKNRYVLVTNENSDTRIWILDLETGEYLSELLGETGGQSIHFDLDIEGDTLIVARYWDPHAIRYYQLLTD